MWFQIYNNICLKKMTTNKELENDKTIQLMWIIVLAILLIGVVVFLTIIIPYVKIIQDKNIIPQEVCVNQTEQVYECANWTCPGGDEPIRRMCAKNISCSPHTEVCDYIIYYQAIPASCKDGLFKLTEKTTQKCMQQKEVCSDGICNVRYKK